MTKSPCCGADTYSVREKLFCSWCQRIVEGCCEGGQQDVGKPMAKPLVYVASPYTKGDPSINTNFQCRVFDQLLTDGVVIPYIPLLTHFQHAVLPRHYQDWIDYDLDFIRAAGFDACLRLNATCDRLPDYRITDSSGADGEVKLFLSMNRPVFYGVEELYAWAKR